MARKTKKFYVVWHGIQPGIYDSWEECARQIRGFARAQYRGYESLEEAEAAFSRPYEPQPKPKDAPLSASVPPPQIPSLSVDAACNMTTGQMEYRGVDTRTGRVIFAVGPFQATTNNVGEFLALVHALAVLNQDHRPDLIYIPIYSDSVTAISWVRKKHANTKMAPCPENEELRRLIMRAEKWLREHTWRNPILKWDTKRWGEIPADFGRK